MLGLCSVAGNQVQSGGGVGAQPGPSAASDEDGSGQDQGAELEAHTAEEEGGLVATCRVHQPTYGNRVAEFRYIDTFALLSIPKSCGWGYG